MLKLLVLLIVAGGAAFVTRPSEAAMKQVADAKAAALTEAATQNADLGGALGGLVARVADGEYENFYVAARYRAPAGDKPLVECWGLFTQTLCNKVGSPQ